MSDLASRDAAEFEALFRRFAFRWLDQYDRALPGLAPGHLRAMTAMKERGPMTMGQVATSLGATLGGATGFADRLVRGGLAVRENDPSDRRVVRIRLTPGGLELAERVTLSLAQHMAQALSRLSAEERVSLLKLWRKLAGPGDDVAAV